MSDSSQTVSAVDVDGYIFSRSVYLQVILQVVLKEMGDLYDKRCLVVGSPNVFISRQLRIAGGEWSDLAFDEGKAGVLRDAIGGDAGIKVFEKGKALPFDGKSFDIVLILDGLNGSGSDYDFIELCHKVLDSDGLLVVCVPREKKLSLISFLRSLFGITDAVFGERQLFDILKNGFDVMQMRSFARFFSELVDVVVRRRAGSRGTPQELMGLYKVAYPFYWVAYQLDLLLFLSKGHRLVARAKRHAWRSRDAPVLSDGRTISEAVLKPLAD